MVPNSKKLANKLGIVGKTFDKTKHAQAYFVALFQCLSIDYHCYREYTELFQSAYL